MLNRADHYGECSILAVEPIEKRPFFHFYPGTKFLSVGLVGCNLRCLMCQNFSVSQSDDVKTKYVSPKDLVAMAHSKLASGIVFTYTEPMIHHQYLLDVCKESDLPIAIKTNGCASVQSFMSLEDFNVSYNVDIKGDNKTYKDICGGGSLDLVLDNIEWISRSGSHLEISYLILPGNINNTKLHRYIIDRICTIDPSIPVHLLYFFPFHKMSVVSYPYSDLIPIWNLFKKKIHCVYISNIFHPDLMKYRNAVCV